MQYLTMIIIGFLMIGIGSVGYLNSIVIEKREKVETIQHHLIDEYGNITLGDIDVRLYQMGYKIVKKETRKDKLERMLKEVQDKQ